MDLKETEPHLQSVHLFLKLSEQHDVPSEFLEPVPEDSRHVQEVQVVSVGVQVEEDEERPPSRQSCTRGVLWSLGGRGRSV